MTDIIVVMADDLGHVGDERILERLPNIKALFIDQGLRFDAAYGETALCCPSRASFLTGQHIQTHHVLCNTMPQNLDVTQTFAPVLHDAGYWTLQVGKYLNNSGQAAIDKTPPGWDVADMSHTGGVNSKWTLNGGPQVDLGYHDRAVIDRTLLRLSEVPEGQPLFAWINPRAPHCISDDQPWKPHVESRYKGDPRGEGIEPFKPPNYDYPPQPDGFPLGGITRALLTTDELVGAMRTALADRDPLWIFCSDNGMSYGQKGFPLKNVPMAGRLVMYFSGPGVLPGSTSALVSNIDLGPTICEIAGTTMPLAEGVSFAPVLAGASAARQYLLEDHPLGADTGTVEYGPYWGIQSPIWHLVQRQGMAAQLYDKRVDPWELTNVAKAHPNVTANLKAMQP